MMMMHTNDQWLGLTFKEYNAIEAVRGSEMRHYKLGGLDLVKSVRDDGIPTSRPMMLGSAFHAMMDNSFRHDWLTAPEGVTRQHKAYKTLVADNRDHDVITAIDAALVTNALEALRADGWVAKVLDEPGAEEPSMIYDGVKIRPDRFQDLGKHIISINYKTTSTLLQFSAWGRKFRYDYQASAGLYQLVYDEVFGAGEVTQYYPVVSMEPPHLVQVYKLAPTTAELAKYEARTIVQAIKDAEDSGRWQSQREVVEL